MSRYVVGITGGVASGKSAATEVFDELGIAVCDADVIARVIVLPGSPALSEIVDVFGSESLTPTGELDRKRMRARIFGDDGARRQLENILHPSIRRALQECAASAVSSYVVVAIPLLAESGRARYPWLDRVLVIDVDPETQLQRLQGRDHLDTTLARAMLAAQVSREHRLAIADDVVANNGTLQDLRLALISCHAAYVEMAAAKH